MILIQIWYSTYDEWKALDGKTNEGSDWEDYPSKEKAIQDIPDPNDARSETT